ncbi:NACHT domain-containing protein [Favolaschia claudopus]|uniref:NACHT domain-containing protein n=1 Tax=Favolaschia claudopus TaxID=2862362 RepID=A0AAV9Z5W7_9AGAR
MRTLLNNISRQLNSVNAASSLTTSIESKQWIREFSENLKREFDIISAIREKGIPNQILKSDDNVKVIEEAIRNIDDHFKAFLLNLIIAMDRKLDHATVAAAIQILHAAASTEASYNSGDSYDRPSCHPRTRTEYLSFLETWSCEPGPGILWMYGPAGTGKSSIAQTFCTQLHGECRLGASFFFKRGHVSRENALKLVPTVAYHLAIAYPEFKIAITQVLGRDPSKLDQTLQMQFQSLIIDPYETANLGLPLVVVIDGLDECEREDFQQEIIRTLAGSQLPLRLLIVSRPEPHIRDTFEEPSSKHASLLEIHGSQDDIRTYFVARLENIRATHKSMHLTPSPWPHTAIIEQLVRRSSGHFIYASTVIKFIEDEDTSPIDGLEIVLDKTNAHDSGSPLAALDSLYLQILNTVPPANRFTLLRILSIVAARLSFSLPYVARFMNIRIDQVHRALRRLHSVLEIPVPEYPNLSLLVQSASFMDFLNDPVRSKDFAITEDLQHWVTLSMARCYSEPHLSPCDPILG